MDKKEFSEVNCASLTKEISKFTLVIRSPKNLNQIVSSKKLLNIINAEWWVTIDKTELRDGRLALTPMVNISTKETKDLNNYQYGFHASSLKSDDAIPMKYKFNRDQSQHHEVPVLIFAKNDETATLYLILEVHNYQKPFIRREAQDILSTMLKKMECHDITFNIKGTHFHAHKSVLLASSDKFVPYFSQNVVDFKIDLNPEIFKIVLESMYGAKLPDNIGNNGKLIYEAATFFQLSELQQASANLIESNLNKENALDWYNWAYNKKDLKELKSSAWKIIKKDLLTFSFKIRETPLDPTDLNELVTKIKSHNEYLARFREDQEEIMC